jgi:ComF family protein
VTSALERLLLPAECLVCHGLLADERADDLVCPVCRSRWRPVRPPWCERCGQPEPHFGPCRLCRGWPTALASVRSAVWLDAGARATVHALKYRGLPRIATDIAAVMARLLAAPLPGARLVPIPLGARRLRTRGYNQSLWLACALGHRWRLRVDVELLTRTRDTRTQTALTPAARLANVAGAFALGIACDRPLPGVVLVDDVFTTGSTLAEAARVVAEAGCLAISAVTFGRATIPDFS